MKKVTVNKLEPGMVTAEQILTKNGQMIVDKASHLQDRLSCVFPFIVF